MYYVIQENLFKEFHFNTLIEYFNRYNLEYEVIKYRPFLEEIEVKTNRKDIWFFGSVTGSRVASKQGWIPGSLYNESHDFEAYGSKYGNYMLNGDGIIIQVGDKIPNEFPEYFFARPTKDTKSFSGQCFSKQCWYEYIEQLKKNSTLGLLTNETKVLLAPLKSNITQEIRCWIVDGKPVTLSQYKIGDRVNMLNMDNNEEAVIFAKDMCKLFCPAKAFVLDICLYNNEYKVVEINCINCSGFYDGDISKLLQTLENTFNNVLEKEK